MKNHEKYLGLPKMCSNYTSKYENSLKIHKTPKYTTIFNFFGNIKIAENLQNSPKINLFSHFSNRK